LSVLVFQLTESGAPNYADSEELHLCELEANDVAAMWIRAIRLSRGGRAAVRMAPRLRSLPGLSELRPRGDVAPHDRVWLVSFMDYDLGYFDNETCRLEPLQNPFGPKVLPMPSE
jgi:hypothetical protein